MACDISKGRTSLSCKDSISGLKAIYVTNYGEYVFTTSSTSAGHLITGLPAGITSSNTFKFELKNSGNTFNQDIISSRDNNTTIFTQTLNFVLPKLSSELEYQIKMLAWSRPQIFVEANNGTMILLGERFGCEITGKSEIQGTMDALNGYSMIAVAVEQNPVWFLTASASEALKALASTQSVGDNTNTTITYNFGAGFAPGYNTNITQALEDTNGDLLIVRGFNTYKGISCPGAVRISKSGDFIRGATGAGFLVAELPNIGCIKSDGSMVFLTSKYNGSTVTENILGLNSDFSIDYSFDPGTGFDSVLDDSYKQIIDVLSDDSIIINAIGPSEYNGYGLVYNTLMKISATGSFDDDFASNLPGISAIYNCIDILNDKILVCGTYDNTFIINADGTTDTSFSVPALFDGEVYFCRFCPDGKVILSGRLDSTSTTPNMIRVTATGSLDTSFNTGTGFLLSGNHAFTTIRDIKFIDDYIYVSGRFNNYNGATVSNLVRLTATGSLDTSFNTGTGFNSTAINALAVSGNDILCFSNFTTYKGLTLSSPRVAALDSLGNLTTIVNN